MTDLQKHVLKMLHEWQEQDRLVVAAIEGGKARWHHGDVDITADALATTNKRIAETEDLIKRFEQS